MISRHTSNVDDYAKNDKSSTSQHLAHGQEEFNLSITSDAKELNADESDQKDGDPNPDIDSVVPVSNGDTSGSQLEGQNC